MNMDAAQTSNLEPTIRPEPQPRGAARHIQLANKLLRQIAREGLRPGSRLGTEMKLAEQHQVSRPTIRNALSILAAQGYISRKKRGGTFVAKTVAGVPSLPMGRGTVVMICPSSRLDHPERDFAFGRLLSLLEQELGRRGIDLQILGFGLDTALDRERLAQLSCRPDLKGAILFGLSGDPPFTLPQGLPVVTFGIFSPGSLPWVGWDVRQATGDIVAHLLSHGHRDIAMICSAWVDPQSFTLFADGYRDAFKARGLQYRRSLLYHAHPGEALQTLAREVLTDAIRPTAILAENWRVVDAVLAICTELHLTIPNDISLVAFGMNALRLRTPVPMTTCAPDLETEVQRLADMLIHAINGEPVAETRVSVAPRLIEGASVRRIGNT